jgi:hypothetical protein
LPFLFPDGLAIDNFEAENFTDRAKRLFEGHYVREAGAEGGRESAQFADGDGVMGMVSM